MRSRSADQVPRGDDHATADAGASRGSVLVVDDEPTIRDVVSRYLVRAGYSAEVAADGAEALSLAQRLRPDLIVLDVMLPAPNGLEVLRRLRADSAKPPAVILLTAKGEESDRISGLRLGADDYVVKPFSPAELVARVDAVFRRLESQAPEAAEPLVFGSLEIDPAARRAVVGGDEATLTQIEFDLLLFLARNPGQVFSRDQLMESVWGSPFYSDTSTVTVHIRRLRSKIESDPTNPERIETVWGVGYRFSP